MHMMCEANKRNEYPSLTSLTPHTVASDRGMAFPLLLWLMQAHQVAAIPLLLLLFHFFSVSFESSAAVIQMYVIPYPFVMMCVFSVSINRSIKLRHLKRKKKKIKMISLIASFVLRARYKQTKCMWMSRRWRATSKAQPQPQPQHTFLMDENRTIFQFRHSNEKCKQREKRANKNRNHRTFMCFLSRWRENPWLSLCAVSAHENWMHFYCFHSWRCRHDQLNQRIAQKRTDE